jgi:hypothetical protein
MGKFGVRKPWLMKEVCGAEVDSNGLKFPLAAVSEGIGGGDGDNFQPFPTPTPMSLAESYESGSGSLG